MHFKMNQLKLFSICYHIIDIENIPLLKLLFIEYCKSELTNKQFILVLIVSQVISKTDLTKDPLYEFMKYHINNNKHIITKQLLNI